MNYFLDLWQGTLTKKAPINPADYLLLSDSEQKQARRFRQPASRYFYIKTRIILRTLLADYVTIHPADIVFNQGRYGKPFIADQPIFFNLSHTDNWLALVVSNFPDIGVDIEQHRSRHHLTGLVGKCFAKSEQDYWHKLPESEKLKVFYQFWVKKEAFVKAVGRGITLGLNQCVINPFKPDEFAMIPVQYNQPQHWQIHEHYLNDNTVCAIVYPNIGTGLPNFAIKPLPLGI